MVQEGLQLFGGDWTERKLDALDQYLRAYARALKKTRLSAHPALGKFAGESSVILHGSTAYGIDDHLSDLDLWLLLPQRAMQELQTIFPTRFVEFQTHGKMGHFTIETVEEMTLRVRNGDLPLICELRAGVVLQDANFVAEKLIEISRSPMREDVRRAWAQFHYVEYRGEHRAADHPIERGDSIAALSAMNACITHALQAASVIHGEPYPYVKWLYQFATKTPTGLAIAPLIKQWMDLLGSGGLQVVCDERKHPMNIKIREMRMALVDAFVANGIDEPWLKEWWLHIPASRAGIKTVRWM